MSSIEKLLISVSAAHTPNPSLVVPRPATPYLHPPFGPKFSPVGPDWLGRQRRCQCKAFGARARACRPAHRLPVCSRLVESVERRRLLSAAVSESQASCVRALLSAPTASLHTPPDHTAMCPGRSPPFSGRSRPESTGAWGLAGRKRHVRNVAQHSPRVDRLHSSRPPCAQCKPTVFLNHCEASIPLTMPCASRRWQRRVGGGWGPGCYWSSGLSSPSRPRYLKATAVRLIPLNAFYV